MDNLSVCYFNSSFLKWKATEIPKLQANDMECHLLNFLENPTHLFWHKIIIALEHINYEIYILILENSVLMLNFI